MVVVFCSLCFVLFPSYIDLEYADVGPAVFNNTKQEVQLKVRGCIQVVTLFLTPWLSGKQPTLHKSTHCPTHIPQEETTYTGHLIMQFPSSC